MLNQCTGTRAFDIEEENERYEDVKVSLFRFKRNNGIYSYQDFEIHKKENTYDVWGFTTMFFVMKNGEELDRFYRLKNAKAFIIETYFEDEYEKLSSNE